MPGWLIDCLASLRLAFLYVRSRALLVVNFSRCALAADFERLDSIRNSKSKQVCTNKLHVWKYSEMVRCTMPGRQLYYSILGFNLSIMFCHHGLAAISFGLNDTCHKLAKQTKWWCASQEPLFDRLAANFQLIRCIRTRTHSSKSLSHDTDAP
jgi:hypothetical protein